MEQNQQTAFISYSREDTEFALKLASALKGAGESVWLDQLDIRYGQDWERTVEEALERCPRMLVILSPASVDSDNVRAEISRALRKKKTVVPIMYRQCEVPLRLDLLHQVDFLSDYERGLRDLLRTLGVREAAGQVSVPTAGGAAAAVVPAREAEKPRTEPLVFVKAEEPTGKRGWLTRIWAGKWRIEIAVISALAVIGVNVGLYMRFASQPTEVAAVKKSDPGAEPVGAAPTPVAKEEPQRDSKVAATGPAPRLVFEECTPAGECHPLKNIGIHREQNGSGSMTLEGPWYQSLTGPYPYVMLNVERNLLLMHPSPTSAAVLEAQVESSGTYRINGAFARANDSGRAGHGVEVAVRSNGASIPGWNKPKLMSSAHDVDPNDVFPGIFDFTIELAGGKSVQFWVSSVEHDASYDATALRFVMSEINGKSKLSLPEDFPR